MQLHLNKQLCQNVKDVGELPHITAIGMVCKELCKKKKLIENNILELTDLIHSTNHQVWITYVNFLELFYTIVNLLIKYAIYY